MIRKRHGQCEEEPEEETEEEEEEEGTSTQRDRDSKLCKRTWTRVSNAVAIVTTAGHQFGQM